MCAYAPQDSLVQSAIVVVDLIGMECSAVLVARLVIGDVRGCCRAPIRVVRASRGFVGTRAMSVVPWGTTAATAR